MSGYRGAGLGVTGRLAENVPVLSRVVLLAGPSGAGKAGLAGEGGVPGGRLAEQVGLPVVRLDDFYRDGDDDAMPRSPLGIVDWDDPRSWDGDRAVAALEQL